MENSEFRHLVKLRLHYKAVKAVLNSDLILEYTSLRLFMNIHLI